MIHSKVKQYVCATLFLSGLLTSACQQENDAHNPLPDTPTGESTSNITLQFTVAGELSPSVDTTPTDVPANADAVNTNDANEYTHKSTVRSNLNGSDNVQHVTAVQLYIFNGTTDNAVCIASEDIDWSAHFGHLPPTVTATMRYRVQYGRLQVGTPYTFLAVGTDDSSRTTYGFPASIQPNTTTLGNAIATLAGTESDTWTRIRQSELFAGSTVLTPAVNGTQGAVDLWRRVAGVMGWFANVPTQISGTTVANIRITLYTQQNKSVPLLPRSQTPVFKDYLATPLAPATGSRVLVEIPVPVGTLPATVLSKGSYLLPVPAPAPTNANDYTLKTELTDISGNVLRSTRVTLSGSDDNNSSTGNGTGVIDPQSMYRFPIVANRFYGIGSQSTPINLGGSVTRSALKAQVITNWEEIISE